MNGCQISYIQYRNTSIRHSPHPTPAHAGPSTDGAGGWHGVGAGGWGDTNKDSPKVFGVFRVCRLHKFVIQFQPNSMHSINVYIYIYIYIHIYKSKPI